MMSREYYVTNMEVQFFSSKSVTSCAAGESLQLDMHYAVGTAFQLEGQGWGSPGLGCMGESRP